MSEKHPEIDKLKNSLKSFEEKMSREGMEKRGISIKKIKVNRDGNHPPGGYEMTIVPPSDKPPYTRDELIAITVKIFTDMNDETKLHMATMFTDMALATAKSEAEKKSKNT